MEGVVFTFNLLITLTVILWGIKIHGSVNTQMVLKNMYVFSPFVNI